MAITVTVFAILYFIDQLTKFLAEKLMTYNRVTFIPNVIDFDLVHNKGAAWSFGDNNTWLLMLVSLVAAIVLMYFARKLDWKNNKIQAIAFTLTLAGCCGNLYDRFMTTIGLMDGVIDMSSFKWFDSFMGLFGAGKSIFNVADIYLVVGIILLAIYYFFIDSRKKEKPNAKKVNNA